jgi:hypothetical protein
MFHHHLHPTKFPLPHPIQQQQQQHMMTMMTSVCAPVTASSIANIPSTHRLSWCGFVTARNRLLEPFPALPSRLLPSAMASRYQIISAHSLLSVASAGLAARSELASFKSHLDCPDAMSKVDHNHDTEDPGMNSRDPRNSDNVQVGRTIDTLRREVGIST